MGIKKFNSVSLVLFTIITFIIKGEASVHYYNLDFDIFSKQETFSSRPKDTIPYQSREIIEGDSEKKNDSLYFKITPRMLLLDGELIFNEIIKEINGIISIKILIGSATYKFPILFKSWHNKGPFLFDIHDALLVTHIGNSVSYQRRKRDMFGTPFGSIQWIESLKTFYLDSIISNNDNYSTLNNFPQRGGYLTKTFQNRHNGDSLNEQKVTLTKDSIGAEVLLKESWSDFHIDKKGRAHAFVYIKGELIYLQQKKASYKPDINTWQEIFSITATDDIGPFTSVSIKGKQYLFTQDGTILKNTGKTMVEVGKLPGDLRNTSVIWDKEKDKMWYITKEEFDAYKAGDTTILQRMHEISLNRR